MIFEREIEKQLFEQVDTKQVIVLTGMRRTGKTTVLKSIFNKISSPNKYYFDIENIMERKTFEENDYNNIVKNLKAYGISANEKAYIFIDEIQFMPNLTSVLKYLHDNYNFKFFVSCSSGFYLKNFFPESLAGRKILFELFPLTFREFLKFKNILIENYDDFQSKVLNKNRILHEKLTKYYDEYLKYGGFPQVVLEENVQQKGYILSDIFSSYFQKDLISLADFRKVDSFKKMIFLLLERVGSKIDITKLASLVGISRDSVYSFLNLLEGSYFIHFISPFTKNKDLEISGTRKFYFCDTGLINQFSSVSEEAILENSVFLNLKQNGTINYFQKRNGMEIDFILNGKSAFEVKKTGDFSDINKLHKLSNQIGIDQYFLISANYLDFENVIPTTLI
jgi:predicted AAA+ superfamily ATPase